MQHISSASVQGGGMCAWECSQEFYIKSLIATPLAWGNTLPPDHDTIRWAEVTEAEFEKAKARLSNFDIILITEWFGKPSVHAYIDSSFELGPGEQWPFPQRYKHGAKWKAHNLNPAQRDRLIQMNPYDQKLYEFARSLSLERMRKAGITDFEPNITSVDEFQNYNVDLSPLGARKQMPCLQPEVSEMIDCETNRAMGSTEKCVLD